MKKMLMNPATGSVATIESAVWALCRRGLHAQHAVGIKVVHCLLEKHA